MSGGGWEMQRGDYLQTAAARSRWRRRADSPENMSYLRWHEEGEGGEQAGQNSRGRGVGVGGKTGIH